MRAAVRAGAALAALAAFATACSGPGQTAGDYTFNEKSSAVKVDTPELRALKKTTGIRPCPTSATPGSRSSNGLPFVTLPCLGGGHSVTLAALRGPLLLNFWSQTCGPCRDESPLLQRFATEARGKVAVMGVDFYDPIPGRALEFTKELHLTYPQIADPDAATRALLHISGLPVTLLIDADGRIAYTQVGAIRSTDELDELVHDHLGVSLAGAAG